MTLKQKYFRFVGLISLIWFSLNLVNFSVAIFINLLWDVAPRNKNVPFKVLAIVTIIALVVTLLGTIFTYLVAWDDCNRWSRTWNGKRK